MKTADCTPNITNLFLSKEKLSDFPLYWIEWLWRWIYLSFSFYLFLTLGGMSLFYTPQNLYLKSYLFFSVLASWMSTSILFRSCLVHLIVNLLALIIFSLLKRCRYYCWTNQKRRPLNAHGQVCALGFSFLKIMCRCLNRGDVCGGFQSHSSCGFSLKHGLLTQSWRAAVFVHRLQQWSLVMVHHILPVKN